MKRKYPVADPEPAIVGLLKRVIRVNSLTDKQRRRLSSDAGDIVEAWKQREDIAELRELLGVAVKPGRRRTQRTADRELNIALAYAIHKKRGTADARQHVAGQFSVDANTVSRLLKKWSDLIDVVMTARADDVENPTAQVFLVKGNKKV